ncbi:MAG: hypothetical protein JSV92_02745 [archaeon]|nr:MAG: hypothetical protein JSV92_02745 [archaeon]
MEKNLTQLTEVKLKEYEKMDDKEIAFLSNFCVLNSEKPSYASERDDQLYSGSMNLQENDGTGEVPLKERIMDRVGRDYDAESKRGNYYKREGNILYLKSIPILIFDDNGDYELITESLLEHGDKKIKKSEKKYEDELERRKEHKGKWKVERKETIENIVFKEIIDTETLKKMYRDKNEYRITEIDDQDFEQPI